MNTVILHSQSEQKQTKMMNDFSVSFKIFIIEPEFRSKKISLPESLYNFRFGLLCGVLQQTKSIFSYELFDYYSRWFSLHFIPHSMLSNMTMNVNSIDCDESFVVLCAYFKVHAILFTFMIHKYFCQDTRDKCVLRLVFLSMPHQKPKLYVFFSSRYFCPSFRYIYEMGIKSRSASIQLSHRF